MNLQYLYLLFLCNLNSNLSLLTRRRVASTISCRQEFNLKIIYSAFKSVYGHPDYKKPAAKFLISAFNCHAATLAAANDYVIRCQSIII
jgi:hypothetical protein